MTSFNFPKYSSYIYENYSFEFKNKEWKTYLQENGFVVIKNAMKKEDCENYKKKLWKVLKALGNADLNDIANRKWGKNYPTSLHGGMFNIGHTRTQWKIRNSTKYIYEDLWDSKDLITSFDKFTYMVKERSYQKNPLSKWIHMDQSIHNKEQSYQGLLCLSDNMNFKSGGNICIPKSHLQIKEIVEKDGNYTKQDWIKLTDEFKDLYVDEENILKVQTKTGDFILWDSRIVHANTAPINKGDERYERVCVYVCMRKRSDANKRTINRRKKAFDELRSTTHNPAKFKLFEKDLGRWGELTCEEIFKRLNKRNLLITEDDKAEFINLV